jgi:hypothetical protein
MRLKIKRIFSNVLPARRRITNKNQTLIRGKPTPYPLLKIKGFSALWQTSPAIILAAAIAFDPHILLLSWSTEHQETVAATSRATCEAAKDAIVAGRWLADDPPAAMRCERGSAFAPGEDCIQGYSCPRRPQ